MIFAMVNRKQTQRWEDEELERELGERPKSERNQQIAREVTARVISRVKTRPMIPPPLPPLAQEESDYRPERIGEPFLVRLGKGFMTFVFGVEVIFAFAYEAMIKIFSFSDLERIKENPLVRFGLLLGALATGVVMVETFISRIENKYYSLIGVTFLCWQFIRIAVFIGGARFIGEDAEVEIELEDEENNVEYSDGRYWQGAARREEEDY